MCQNPTSWLGISSLSAMVEIRGLQMYQNLMVSTKLGGRSKVASGSPRSGLLGSNLREPGRAADKKKGKVIRRRIAAVDSHASAYLRGARP